MAAETFDDLIHKLRGELLSEMPPAEVVLSAGCSGSWYFQWFDDKYPHQIGRHIGFDLEPPPKNLPPKIEWHQRSFSDMSAVPDNSVDLVYAGQAIEHISVAECLPFLNHAHRVLKDQGWLVMDSPNFSITGPSLYLHPEHVVEYTPGQMEAVLEAAGFRVINRKGILLCRENGKLLDDPFNYERINDRRAKAAKERPDDSFVWWIEARRSGRFNTNRLARLLSRIDRAYERDRARFAKREERAKRERTAGTQASSHRPKVGFRQMIRRLVPRRLRWLVRAAFKRITGLYYRDIMRQQRDFTERLDAIQHQATVALPAQFEAQGEVMDLLLRRLRTMEEEIAAFAQPLGRLQAEVAGWGQWMRSLATNLAVQQLPSPAAERQAAIAIFCRSLGRRCGVGEYANYLAQRLGGVAVSSVDDLPPEADIVFVQYEPSLYPAPGDIIEEVDRIRPPAIVVVDAHTISPDLADELRWHAIVGTKRNFYPGTVHLSLALPPPPPPEGEVVEGIRLGSFGLALPAKRYELVIQLAHRLGVGATILAAHANVTPGYSERSASYLAHIKSLASSDIEIIDDYLPMEEVIRRLRQCSYLVSCMDDNGEQSASLRAMAIAGRPLISLRTEQAREVGAILVDDLDAITLEFLQGCSHLPQAYDGIADYIALLQRLTYAQSLVPQILHNDDIYLHDPRQMERLAWLRQNVEGRAIDIGVGNGFSTNYIRAVAGVEIRPDRLTYASLRYPHIDFRLLDAKAHALPGFDTVVFGEIVEHMSPAEAKHMLELWACTGPERILVTTPNAGKPDYDANLVHTPEHVWEPREELMPSLVPAGYRPTVTTTGGGDFLLVDMRKKR